MITLTPDGPLLPPGPRRLNLGCGRQPLPGWINVDKTEGHGIDIVWDIEHWAAPLPPDCIDEFLLSHVIEHFTNPLYVMEQLWRIAKPRATMVIRCPYGGSDDAWEDPTHMRAYFLQSFGYFSQPYYWRADYGYRGDWQPTQIELAVSGVTYLSMPKYLVLKEIMAKRNIVQEMVCMLTAIKPAREPDKASQTLPSIDFRFT